MKMFGGLLAIFFSLAAGAAPCFYPGTYEGKGFGVDQQGNVFSYEVRTVVSSSTQVSSHYSWAEGQADFAFQASNGALLVGGQNIGATINCDWATESLHIPNANGIELSEEWLLAGNYLLRHGTKVIGQKEIQYQELLLRKE
jgi:hypothetical protein